MKIEWKKLNKKTYAVLLILLALLSVTMFVTGISAENNTVPIGENGSQYSIGLVADRMNYIAFENLTEPMKAQVKIRFKARPESATVTPNADGTSTIVFEEPQRSVTPGQGAVIYDGDIVIGGGRIIAAIKSSD